MSSKKPSAKTPPKKKLAYAASKQEQQQQRRAYSDRVDRIAKREQRRPIGAPRDVSRYPGPAGGLP